MKRLIYLRGFIALMFRGISADGQHPIKTALQLLKNLHPPVVCQFFRMTQQYA